MATRNAAIQKVSEGPEVGPLHRLMVQLRPHIATEAEFIGRWTRQVSMGYSLIALYVGGKPEALAGFRVQENLLHGRHLYIDDLVVDGEMRGRGHGAALLTYLHEEARQEGCTRLLLDAAMGNPLAHRFYFRAGFLATSLRFSMPVAPSSSQPHTNSAFPS